jgi:hypothetical protein
VGPILDFKFNDRKARRQEVKFVDQSDKAMFITLVLWDSVFQVFTTEWKPFLTSNYLNLIFIAIGRISLICRFL